MKAKKFMYSLGAALLMGMMVSCDDALKEQPYGKLTMDEFLKDPSNFRLLVGQVYTDITWLHDHWLYFGLCTLSSDEGVIGTRTPGSDWSDGDFWRALNTHTWDAKGLAFEYVWNTCNSGAISCNKNLQTLEEYKDKFSDSDYARYKAELEVVRSFYYYTLFDCFGRIPYTEKFSNEYVPLMEPEDVWKNLVRVLVDNAEAMPEVDNPSREYNYALATKGMAYTMLARLYLNAESFGVSPATLAEYDVYTKCVDACDKVINSGKYRIEDDFFTNFKINNEGSEENIFVILEDGSNNNVRSTGYPMNKLRIIFLSHHYNIQKLWNTQLDCWNGFCATEEFINLYDANDHRGASPDDDLTGGSKSKGRWGWMVGPVYSPKDKVTGKDSISVDTGVAEGEYGRRLRYTKKLLSQDGHSAATVDDLARSAGARFWKYEPDTLGQYKYMENDFVLLRYADVLYMKAEAILRGGKGSIANQMADFQKMQTRVGLDASRANTIVNDLDEIYKERAREFAWELTRRRDMIRFKTFWTAVYGFNKGGGDEHLKWFPISETTLASEPRWTQNPGY